MKNQEPTIVFNRERASNHDQQFAKLAPIRDGLDLSICMVLSELPDDARILCVGGGTGGELIPLAQHFPNWQFTAVEPAAPMLNNCFSRPFSWTLGMPSELSEHSLPYENQRTNPCF